jgi:Ca-activated chloride channel family protein
MTPRPASDPTRRRALPAGLALFVAVLVAASGLLAACNPLAGPTTTLTVLAGSELKDMEPIWDEMAQATGVRLVPTYIGTLEGAEKIEAGDTSDLAWFSHSKYLTLLPGMAGKIIVQQPIMLSPVVLGVKQSKARAFGWENNPNVTWKDIAAKAADGELKYAMTNPTASNSGFTALVGVASAFAGSADALNAGDVDSAELQKFFAGQALTAGSSGFLSDAYVRQQDQLDGMINYESVLLGLNRGGTLHEPLDLIYPKEGIITANYPLMLLNSAKRDAYDKIVAWLTSPTVQTEIMTKTLRRPAIPEVKPNDAFPSALLVELPFPSTLDTINALLFAYLDKEKVPASAVFVLDVSGSMEGDRLDKLKTALGALTGTDQSITGQFARFRAREQITIITFSDVVQDTQQFTVDDTDPNGPDMTAIRNYVDGLQAGGGTAIYSALDSAYDVVAQQQAADPSRYYSIVLMTDGENHAGIDQNQFIADYKARSPAVQGVKTFTVLFGDASPTELQQVADATGGQEFDATTDDLSTIFKRIRGYQ